MPSSEASGGLRRALCSRALFGYGASVPIVAIVGMIGLMAVMGDPKPGTPPSPGRGHVVLLAGTFILGLEAVIPIVALRSARRAYPHDRGPRPVPLAFVATLAWFAGLCVAATLSGAIPVWLTFIAIGLYAVLPVGAAVGAIYVMAQLSHGPGMRHS